MSEPSDEILVECMSSSSVLRDIDVLSSLISRLFSPYISSFVLLRSIVERLGGVDDPHCPLGTYSTTMVPSYVNFSKSGSRVTS